MPIDAGGGRMIYRRPAVPRKRRDPQPKPRPAARGIPVGLGPKPFERAQQQADRQVKRAQQALPRQPRRNPSLPPRKAAPLPAGLGGRPFAQAQRQAAQKTRRAERRLPAQPKPNPSLPPSRAALNKAALKIALSGVPLAGRREPLQPVKPKGEGGTFGAFASVLPAGVANRILGTALQVGLASTGSSLGRAGGAAEKLAVNAAKDAINIPAETLTSTYRIGQQGVGAFEKGARRGGLAAGALAAAKTVAPELAQPYVELAKNPVRQLTEHPLQSYLLFEGVRGGLGRSAGRAGRLGVFGPAGRRIASTRRAAAAEPGTALVERRAYSPDLMVKGGQVLKERRAATKARRMTQQAEAAAKAGDEAGAAKLRARAVKANPRRMSEHQIRRRIDERMAVNETTRKQAIRGTVKETDQAVGKKPTVATTLTAQAITRASHDDLRAYARELEGEAPRLSGTRLAANQALRKEIAKVVDSGGDLARVERAASAYRKVTAPLERELVKAGMLDARQARTSALIPYAVRRMGARHDGERIVDAAGNPLTAEAIEAHMAAHGVEAPAYVTQAPSQRGARNFFIDSNEPKRINTGPRTGEATRAGTFDAHPDVLRETAARMQSLVQAHKGFQAMLGEVALRGKSGKPAIGRANESFRQAADRAREASHKYGREYVPVRANAFAGRSEQLQALMDGIADPSKIDASYEAMERAVVSPEGGSGPYVLIPKAAADQIAAHARLLGQGGGLKLAQLISKSFRTTVLALSSKWLTGNIVEAMVRAAVAGAGPRSYMAARRMRAELYRIDPEKGAEFDARVIGGGHYAMNAQLPRRGAEQFRGTKLEGVANALGAFWRAPGPKHLAAGWNAYTHFIFETVNHNAETFFQTAMAGRAARKQLMPDGIVRYSKGAVEQAAHGLRNTHAQVALGRAVDDMYGRYAKFSPGARQAIVLYTPFAAWGLSAVNFLYHVLPRDHPVLLSLMASANAATDQWRKDRGLDMFIKDRVPGFLQGSIPLPDGGHLRVQRYTPFAFAADPMETFGNMLLPQVSGVVHALQGQAWNGTELENPDGSPVDDVGRAVAALDQFMQATVPALGQTTRVAAGEGPLPARLNKEFNPFAPTRTPSDSKGGVVSGPTGPQRLTPVEQIQRRLAARADLQRSAQQARILQIQLELARRAGGG